MNFFVPHRHTVRPYRIAPQCRGFIGVGWSESLGDVFLSQLIDAFIKVSITPRPAASRETADRHDEEQERLNTRC